MSIKKLQKSCCQTTVNLRGKNLAERAKLMVSLAAPEFREELDRAAAERFGYSYLRLK